LCVLNKNGEILKWSDDVLFRAIPKVNLDGDIYLMFAEATEKTYSFYRIPNTWDPIDTESCSHPSITASSYIDWKNTYTPSKAFDCDLKTCWLEAAKDAGIGESITLKLDKDITVDKITIAPGYFDPKWWKSNNRIKKLKVKYGDEYKIIQFADKMEKQSLNLGEEIRFKEISFEIKDVYSSGKDNDTGISEIEFYYKGEKVEIDISGIK
jgi:hypothetical protein